MFTRVVSFSQEGTMSTEFRYGGKECGACGVGAYSPHSPGSFGGGPWTLRPKRLQWLRRFSTKIERRPNITAGFKIAAFLNVVMRFGSIFSISVTPAQAGAQLSTILEWRKVDSRLRGNDELGERRSKPMNHSQALSLTAIYHSPLSICGLEAMAGTSPPFFLHQMKAGST